MFRKLRDSMISVFLTIVFLFLFVSQTSPTYGNHPIQDEITPAHAVVRLLVTTANGSLQGSGVIVSPGGIIFTAAHVVENASEIRVEYFNGFDAPPLFGYYANIQYLSPYEDFDFAVLEIVADERGELDSIGLDLPFIQSWNFAVAVKDPIEVYGYMESARGFLHVTRGIIGSTPRQPVLIDGNHQERYMFYQVDTVTGSGSSGGLAVNSENEFIGIPINWENDEGGYVATILPISTICELEPDACLFEPLATNIETVRSDSSCPEVNDLLNILQIDTEKVSLSLSDAEACLYFAFAIGEEFTLTVPQNDWVVFHLPAYDVQNEAKPQTEIRYNGGQIGSIRYAEIRYIPSYSTNDPINLPCIFKQGKESAGEDIGYVDFVCP